MLRTHVTGTDYHAVSKDGKTWLLFYRCDVYGTGLGPSVRYCEAGYAHVLQLYSLRRAVVVAQQLQCNYSIFDGGACAEHAEHDAPFTGDNLDWDEAIIRNQLHDAITNLVTCGCCPVDTEAVASVAKYLDDYDHTVEEFVDDKDLVNSAVVLYHYQEALNAS